MIIGIEEHTSWVWPEAAPAMYQNQTGMEPEVNTKVYIYLISMPIPGLYLLYTRHKSAFGLIPVRVSFDGETLLVFQTSVLTCFYIQFCWPHDKAF
jgi:hypothetical protein